jgi:hypothetical protein
MQEPRAQRTLVKSPPELWAEVSDVEALARHLGEFGEIRITRLEPETTVAWEGDRACGTVALEPSGWGTKVTITAKLAQEPAPEPVAVEPEPEPAAPAAEAATAEPVAEAEPELYAPEPIAEAEPEPDAPEPIAEAEPDAEAPKEGFFARLFGRRRKVESVVDVEPEPEPLDAERAEAILTGVLDDLGSAHHRPFSRS